MITVSIIVCVFVWVLIFIALGATEDWWTGLVVSTGLVLWSLLITGAIYWLADMAVKYGWK